MTAFRRQRTIFADKDVLRESYQPDGIVERDDEIQEYKDALQPVIDGWEPNNIFVYGNTGVGKTAVTHYLLDLLQSDAETYDDLDLDVIKLNCKSLTSSYQVAVRLVNELRPSGGEISTTGYPQSTVFSKLYDELEALGGTILIVLDEIDSISDDDTILYELPRARANGHLGAVKPGIIGISNDFNFRDNLGSRVQDTLCEREIQFSPYTADELQSILRQRADKAIHDDALSDDVIPLCAALAAKDRGSARQALDLLLYAGEIAETRDDDTITTEHVDAAQSEIEKERVEQGMHELTQHGHLALLAVVSLAVEGEAPERTRVIYDRYTNLCEFAGSDPLSQRSVHNHLSDLQMFGILNSEEARGGSPGNWNVYELNVPLKSALAALEEELPMKDVIERIRDDVDESSLL